MNKEEEEGAEERKKGVRHIFGGDELDAQPRTPWLLTAGLTLIPLYLRKEIQSLQRSIDSFKRLLGVQAPILPGLREMRQVSPPDLAGPLPPFVQVKSQRKTNLQHIELAKLPFRVSQLSCPWPPSPCSNNLLDGNQSLGASKNGSSASKGGWRKWRCPSSFSFRTWEVMRNCTKYVREREGWMNTSTDSSSHQF